MVLATGARNRKLPVEGADLTGVLYLRTMAESDAIKERFAAAQEIVVAGAGFIGWKSPRSPASSARTSPWSSRSRAS